MDIQKYSQERNTSYESSIRIVWKYCFLKYDTSIHFKLCKNVATCKYINLSGEEINKHENCSNSIAFLLKKFFWKKKTGFTILIYISWNNNNINLNKMTM